MRRIRRCGRRLPVLTVADAGNHIVQALLFAAQACQPFAVFGNFLIQLAAAFKGAAVALPQSLHFLLLLFGQPLQLGQLFIDGGLLLRQLRLLLCQPADDLFVGAVDVARVGQEAAFLVGIGIFQKQNHGAGLPVAVIAGQQAGDLRFGAGNVGLQARQFGLQVFQLLPCGFLAAREPCQFTPCGFQFGFCPCQCLLRAAVCSLPVGQAFFGFAYRAADVVQLRIVGLRLRLRLRFWLGARGGDGEQCGNAGKINPVFHTGSYPKFNLMCHKAACTLHVPKVQAAFFRLAP